jgi:hypothetical protein
MIESKHFRCYYKKEFPVDEYGRPGGLYSLVDLPIAKYEVLHRPGVVIEVEESNLLLFLLLPFYHHWEFWVPKDDVSVGEIDDDDI